jgi:hypothetical protein
LTNEVNNYYDFLASIAVKYLGNSEFWKRQREGLQEAGMRFSPSKLYWVILIRGLKLLLTPRKAIKKILAIKKERKNASTIEATYY